MKKRTSVTVTPVLWSRKDKDNLHPIKIRVTTERKSQYVSVGYSVKKLDWSQYKRNVKSTHPDHERINFEIEQMVLKIEGNQSKRVRDSIQMGSNLVEYIQMLIDQKRRGNKYYSTKRYNTLLQHLVSFWGNHNIHFYDIDSNIITEFRYYLETNVKPKGIEKEPSPNTVNNYLKVLRSVYNRAIQDGVYFGGSPFKDGHITRKKRTSKKPLSKDELWFLDNLSQDRERMTEGIWDSVNVFLFCFWSQGIRIGDCLQLKYGNLIDGSFEIIMDKTEMRHRFPLTRNNLFRVLCYIDELPKFFDWDKGKYISTSHQEEDEKFVSFGVLPNPLTQEVEILGSHTKFIQDRNTLYENLEKNLSNYNRRRHIDNRVDFYTDEKYNLYDREYFHLVQESNNPADYHWYHLYHESKDLFLRLGMKYLTEYCKKKENQNKFVFPFLRGLEDEVGHTRWNKISSSTALVNKNLRKISERYGIRPFSSHYSRHTFTSLSKDMGVDIYDLKNWLGHTSVKTTEGYVNSVDSSGVVRHNERMNDFFKK